ncbi:unnamed protein product [Cuscuta epithymum]|uniref:Uncharacterized protein n=1 Tax=Cuscuta epithymum TaxID=186058 RepID=A0AAV0F5I2_9ASTE|nr:unnamed protein product [Cuscuta epithymum]
MTSRAVPYTGGDVKKSGELGKMYGVDSSSGHHQGLYVQKPLSRAPSSSQQHNNAASRSRPNSGQQGHKSNTSGPIPKKSMSFSGPTPIQPTGLITSNSGPLDSTGGRSGHPEPSGSFNKKVHYSGAVTRLVKDAQPRGPLRFLNKFPDAELRSAIDGQFVKITGVVTCGSIPLETSFRRTLRCVYVSTELYEYRGWGGKPANSTHRFFSWGKRHSEKFVADFYISDLQSGLRALVKAGYGAKVTPFVKPSKVIDVTQSNRELSPNFLQWLADRNLSSDDRIMRLKEGYIKEGSTVSVMGVVRRQANVLMIVPPSEPISTGCQWGLCLPPSNIDALILACDESQNSDVIPV